MTNAESLSRLCNSVCSAFYPDEDVVETSLYNSGLEPSADAVPKDPAIFRCAVPLVMGFVEGSRSEGGVSVSVREDAVLKSLRVWCGFFGLRAEEELGSMARTIRNGSNLW